MATLSGQAMYDNAQPRRKQVTYGKTTRNPAFGAQRVGSFFEESQSSDRIESKSSLPRPPRARLTNPGALTPRRAERPSSPTRDEFDFPSDDDHVPEPVQAKLKSSTLKTQAATTVTRTSRQNKRGPTHDVVPANATQSLPPATEPGSARKRRKTASPQPNSLHATHIASENSRLAPIIKMPVGRRVHAKLPSPSNGTSAPARLAEMLSNTSGTEEDLDDPLLSLSTAPLAAPSPRRALKRSTSTTPKQSHLWDQILPSGSGASRPITTNPHSGPRQTRRSNRAPGIEDKAMVDLSSAHIQRRPRLVDRLKQDARRSGLVEYDDVDTVVVETDSTVDKTPTVNVSFSQAQSAPAPPLQNADSQSQQTNTSQTVSGLRLTYSRDRSYLQEDDLEDDLLFAMPDTISNRPTADVRRGQPTPDIIPKSLFDLDDESDEGSKTIRSIHELRAAGRKKRFNDDNQTLLDDIRDHRQSARSRRRSALMELASKFDDKTFLGRFVELGFDQKLAAEFSSSGFDPVADTMLCAALMRMLDGESIERSITGINEAGALEFFADRLGNDKDVVHLARDRRNNMSKVAQSTLIELAEAITTSSMWGECLPETLSTRLLALKCMDLMILKLRRQGNHAVMPNLEAITALVGIATTAPAPASLVSPSNAHTITTQLSLAVLEGASAMNIAGNSLNVWSTQLLTKLATALPSILAMSSQVRTLYLRLCLNLTNNQAPNCALFSDEHIAQALVGEMVAGFNHLREVSDEQEALLGLDDLLLSLGLMINLAEFSNEVCETVAALPDNGLVALVTIFLQGQKKAEEAESMGQSHGNVAHGYLAVLLGNLCQNQLVRARVKSILPGQRLEVLVAAVEEFVQYHKKVDSQTFEGEEGQEVWTHFTDRLMAVVARLRSGERYE